MAPGQRVEAVLRVDRLGRPFLWTSVAVFAAAAILCVTARGELFQATMVR